MATTATLRVAPATGCTPPLALAFAVGANTGPRGCTPGAAPRPRERPGPAGEGQAVLEALRRAQSRVGLPEEAWGAGATPPGREGV
jgi:hypothetical protein